MKNTFPTFWQFLQKLVDLDCTYRTDGGPPDCKIRQCAKQKGVEICTQRKECPKLSTYKVETTSNTLKKGRTWMILSTPSKTHSSYSSNKKEKKV